jgi:ribosomal-protein-alanine N-acetyltransferase
LSLKIIEKEAKFTFLPEVIALENDVQLSPWSLKNFEDALTAKNLFKVFFIEKKLVGYYVALLAADECQLLNLAIHSDFQNNGYGHYLITHLKKICVNANVASIFLEVRSSNKKAIRLYEKNEFNELGIRNNYYKNNIGWEDGILMGSEL